MRFNDKTVLSWMIDKSLSLPDRPLFAAFMPGDHTESDRLTNEYNNKFRDVRRFFDSGNIYFVTEPFLDAFESAKPKLNLLFDTEKTGINSGQFVYRTDGNIYKNIFYNVNHTGDKFELLMYEMLVYKEWPIPVLSAAINVSGSQKDNILEIDRYMGVGYQKVNITYYELMAELCGLLLFIKYVDKQIKIIEPRQKTVLNKEKTINETKSKLKILDSRYFTEIRVNGKFPVTGHWRMQRMGEGRSKSELRWIEAYEKNGYHRKATIDDRSKIIH